ncbi:hypothetical protein BURK2_03760 [Burkholderiales bacterium]|nr:hypothetical protein BURK2_03760 [Burkholderiales bacterium]
MQMRIFIYTDNAPIRRIMFPAAPSPALSCARLPFTHLEAMMTDRFGQAYRDYCRRTGRILPKRTRA